MPDIGVHNRTLVVLSVAIAVIASYTALDLAARMRTASALGRQVWLAGAALAMGGGIWSMHFVAMLAFSVPGMDVTYDLPLTLASFGIAILFTGVGFACANLPGASLPVIAASGLIMGLGIAGMHYTGMAAMRMPADLGYSSFWVGVSLLIAVGASSVALWLSFRRATVPERIVAALVMGVAVSGMHYAAMRGATFAAHEPMAPQGFPTVGQTNLALWVATTTFVILLMAMSAATLDRTYAQRLRREAQALRDSEERFRLLVQSVSDYAIVMLDPEGRVTNWNSGAERIHGYAANDIVGHSFAAFYCDEDRAAGKPDRVLATAREKGKFTEEAWRVRKDGSRFFASVVLNAIHAGSGELVGFAKVSRDLTDWRATQQQLEQAREALFQAQKMDAIGQLTGGVAHDFNNLLMAVLGSLELLRKRMPDDPRLLRLVDNAIQGAQRGASLTQRMLSFARRQNLQPEPVDLRALINGMTDLLSRSIGPQHRIETQFPHRLPAALVDPHQLELAILNLVVNARDAMPGGGPIVIAAHEEPGTGADTSPPMVVIEVSDRGVGMDDETLARAQEPFFTTKGVGKGTGLGLSMVHGLAEQSSGRLVLRSKPGEGTTAEMWLPVAQAEAPSTAQGPLQAGAACRRSLRVLVVDDDPLVLENTAAMLEDLGHMVIQATSAEEALAILDDPGGIDALITDQIMPGLTGTELADRVIAWKPGTIVIVVTGYMEASVPAPYHRMQKPFSQPELSAALTAAMQARDEA